VAFPVVVKPTATATGLVLRLWEEQDVPALVAAHRDPLLRRWLRHPFTSTEQARRVIEARRAEAQAGRAFSLAVLETAADGEAGRLVGGVSLRRRDAATPGAGTARAGTPGAGTATAEVGYWVAAPARGRGVASTALNATCEWALGTLRNPPLERLELIHSVANLASCRVAEKTGFTLSAVLPALPPDFPDDGHLHVRLR
jgi:RimJ/RimL family protein N-acetyltransferase